MYRAAQCQQAVLQLTSCSLNGIERAMLHGLRGGLQASLVQIMPIAPNVVSCVVAHVNT